jgi:ATP-binding cassette subfamily B (MDR/TAP) protein 1
VVALLERFYLPSSGSIKIDGVPIQDLDLKWLRNQMAIVSQEPILFSTSIRYANNIGYLCKKKKEFF